MEHWRERCGILAVMEHREALKEHREAVNEMVQEPEASLIAEARRGGAAAFETLVRTHLDQVWRVVWRILRHREDTEDVVQEVFMAAHKSLPGFREGSRFATWLHRIAVNRALNHLDRSAEKLRRASAPLEDDAGPQGPHRQTSRDAGPLARLEAGELGRRLRECLEKLPAAWRAVLALRVNEELAYEEIASVQEIAVGTVRSRLSRARLALRDCMGEEAP